MAFAKYFSGLGIGWSTKYNVPSMRQALGARSLHPAKGGGEAVYTSQTPFQSHTKTPEPIRREFPPAAGFERLAPEAEAARRRNAEIQSHITGNVQRLALHLQCEARRAAARPRNEHPSESVEASVRRHFRDVVDDGLNTYRDDVLMNALVASARTMQIEVGHLAEVLASAVKEAGQEPTATAAHEVLQLLHATDFAAFIRDPGAPLPRVPNATGQPQTATMERMRQAWKALTIFHRTGMLNNVLEWGRTRNDDLDRAGLRAYLNGAAEFMDQAAAAGRVLPSSFPADVFGHLGRQARDKLSDAGRGLLATQRYFRFLAERRGQGEQSPNLDAWQDQDRWRFGLLLNGYGNAELTKDGELTEFGRAEMGARKARDRFAEAVGDPVSRLCKIIAPLIGKPAPNPLDAYNKLGPGGHAAAGFRNATHGAIAQGRSIKEGMLLELRQALLARGGGSEEQPAAIPCGSDGSPCQPPGQALNDRTLRNLVRLAICEAQLATTPLLPEFSYGYKLDSLRLNSAREKLAGWLQLPGLRSAGEARDRSELEQSVLRMIEEENRPLIPELLADWARALGAPADITRPLPRFTPDGDAAAAADGPDWRIFRAAYAQVRHNDLGERAPESTRLDMMVPDAEPVCRAISNSVESCGSRLGLNDEQKHAAIARGTHEFLKGAGSLEKTFKRSTVGKHLKALVTRSAQLTPLDVAKKRGVAMSENERMRKIARDAVNYLYADQGSPGRQVPAGSMTRQDVRAAGAFAIDQATAEPALRSQAAAAFEARLDGWVADTVRRVMLENDAAMHTKPVALVAALGGDERAIEEAILASGTPEMKNRIGEPRRLVKERQGPRGEEGRPDAAGARDSGGGGRSGKGFRSKLNALSNILKNRIGEPRRPADAAALHESSAAQQPGEEFREKLKTWKDAGRVKDPKRAHELARKVAAELKKAKLQAMALQAAQDSPFEIIRRAERGDLVDAARIFRNSDQDPEATVRTVRRAIRRLDAGDRDLTEAAKLFRERYDGAIGQAVQNAVRVEGSDEQARAAAVVAALGGDANDIAAAILDAAPAAHAHLIGAPGVLSKPHPQAPQGIILNRRQAKVVAGKAVKAIRNQEQIALRERIEREAAAVRGKPSRPLVQNALKIAAATWNRKPPPATAIKDAVKRAALTVLPREDQSTGSAARPEPRADAAAIAAACNADPAIQVLVREVVAARLNGVTGRTVREIMRAAGAAPAQVEAAAAAAALGCDADDLAAVITEAGQRGGVEFKEAKKRLFKLPSESVGESDPWEGRELNDAHRIRKVVHFLLREVQERGRLESAARDFEKAISNFELGSGLEMAESHDVGAYMALAPLLRAGEKAAGMLGLNVAAGMDVSKGEYMHFHVNTTGAAMVVGDRTIRQTRLSAGASVGLMGELGGVGETPLIGSAAISHDNIKSTLEAQSEGLVVRLHRKGGVAADNITAGRLGRIVAAVIDPHRQVRADAPLLQSKKGRLREPVLKRILQIDPFASVANVKVRETTVTHKKKTVFSLGLKSDSLKTGVQAGVERSGVHGEMKWEETKGRLVQEVQSFTDTSNVAFSCLASVDGSFTLKSGVNLGLDERGNKLLSAILGQTGMLMRRSAVRRRDGGTIKATMIYLDDELQPQSFLVDDHLTAASYVDSVLRELDEWAGAKVDRFYGGKQRSPDERAAMIRREKANMLEILLNTLKEASPPAHFQRYYEINDTPLPGEAKSRLEMIRDEDRTIRLAALAGDIGRMRQARERRRNLFQDRRTWSKKAFLVDLGGMTEQRFSGINNIAGVTLGTSRTIKTTHINDFL